MRVRLEVTSGPSRGRSITLRDGDVTLVGRAPWCNLIIGGDERCSQSHVLVVVHPPHCHLRDLRSKHGTYVNDARISDVASLNSGDRLHLGESEIAVEFIQPEVAAAQPAEAAGSPSGPALRVQEPPAGSVRAPVGEGAPVFVCERCREEMRRTGEQVPGYRIIRLISQGGMGRVWEAERLTTSERVAIKTMIPEIATSRRGVHRYRREMRIAQRLQHPNIVRCIEAGEHQGLFYIVMELVAGENAEQRRQRQGGDCRTVRWCKSAFRC